MKILFMVLLFITATLLILLILVQKGKGGGLAGAFGGMGGQSAFGTKAGDLFTKITIGLATFWIILCLVSVAVLTESSRLKPTVGTTPASSSSDSGTGEGTPAPEGDATPENPAGS
ncbi:MAG: preprotein translocase subunit SecG [Planctomycetia bacterium]|nr:preprotein translocase subunit SecG [Planctomycetia bacterium]